jgi:GTP cyclohydrolase II
LEDSAEHIAIGLGRWESLEAPLVRVHSECLTGDIFGSAKCDCGEQLQEALERLERDGGILLYLRQEGRGIGLYNKLDAYELQQKGMDTYEANRTLGFRDDQRSYGVAARMLDALGVKKIRLLSNNPDKKLQLERHGVVVSELVSTGVFLKRENRRYLEAKISVTGHKIALSTSGDGR